MVMGKSKARLWPDIYLLTTSKYGTASYNQYITKKGLIFGVQSERTPALHIKNRNFPDFIHL
jgi:hypothetical protein